MSVIQLKRSVTGGAAPTAGDLVAGELAVNLVDSKIFHKSNSGAIVELGLAPAERTKLSGIAAGATANDTDANLKNRANHTGSQAIGTVTNLQSSLDAKAPLASPALTGTPTAPTASGGTSTTQLATTAFATTADNALSARITVLETAIDGGTY